MRGMDGERIDGGERSVVGGDLPRRVGGAGDRFNAGGPASVVLDQSKRGERGPVDARNRKGLRPRPGMTVAEFAGICTMTDAELRERLLALRVYRANGLSVARCARKLGVPVGVVKSWQAEGRARKLTFPALDEARAFVEDHLVDLAVDTLHEHLKQHNLEAGLATLRGVGVLRNGGDVVDGRLPTQLNVQIVDANGVMISVGGTAPKLEGVVGTPKAHRLDLAPRGGELV